MSKWIRKNDRVVVITGNEKGKVGVVLSCHDDHVTVQGINLRKKHIKRTQQTQAAKIIDIEMPLHISNVRFCKEDGTPIRVRPRIGKKGSKDLVYKDKDKEIVLREIKKAKQ